MTMGSGQTWVSVRLGRRVAAAVTAVALASSILTPAVQAAQCAQGRDASALQVRVVQSQAMVAALACGEGSRYNDFVVKFRTELVSHGTVLRQFFDKTYGKSGSVRLNSFVTELANRESSRSVADRSHYCTEAASLFDSLRDIHPENFGDLANALPNTIAHGYDVCVQRAASNVR